MIQLLMANLIFFSIQSVHGSEQAVRIRQLDLINERVSIAVPSTQKLKHGDYLEVDVEGISCRLMVTSSVSKMAIASTRECKHSDLLKIGQILKPAESEIIAGVEPIQKSIEKKPNPVRSSRPLDMEWPELIVHYSSASHAVVVGESDRTSLGTNGAFGLGGAFGIGARYSDVKAQRWGWMISTSYELSREVLSGSDTLTDFSFIILEPSATYGLGEASYLLSGFNMTVPFSGSETLELGGQLGLHMGIGYRLAKNFSFEGQYRSLNFTMNPKGIENTESVRLWGLFIRGVYSFQ